MAHTHALPVVAKLEPVVGVEPPALWDRQGWGPDEGEEEERGHKRGEQDHDEHPTGRHGGRHGLEEGGKRWEGVLGTRHPDGLQQ